MKKILITIGTRPNMIKVTQFKRIADQMDNLEVEIAHTGQHYDYKMAQVFFDQFELRPDHKLTLENRTPLSQMAEMMTKLESLFSESKPDMVLVPGDVNSTFASAFAAHKAGILLGHIESGLRSFDRSMPEEINRILTDEITDHYFVTEPSGIENLQNEGRSMDAIHHVGNTMIDTLVHFEPKIDASNILDELSLTAQEYILLTFHRPANVDVVEEQQKLVSLLSEISARQKCVFPIHPRTQKALANSGLLAKLESNDRIILTEPLGYFEFQRLVKNALAVVTDSGGIQEETTFRQVPCLTLRPNTERPVTIDIGTNKLLPFDLDLVMGEIDAILSGRFKSGQIPENWDGQATNRILEIIQNL